MTDDRFLTPEERERERRWRLVLGEVASPESDRSEKDLDELDVSLEGSDQEMDQVLRALYDSDRKAGLGSSSPRVNRWLGDIRRFFPSSVVRLMQKDALERLKLHEMLLQPETLEGVDADVHLVATLLSLKNVIPEKTRDTARQVVRRVVREIEERLREPLASAVRGALLHAERTRRPRPREIDWDRTIRKNLNHWLVEQQTLVPEQLIGRSRRRPALQELILCVDQSGSMATSVVYAGIFAAALASLPAVRMRMVVFDTEVADLSEHLSDPVDLLFGVQLGGGTDIARAMQYCRQQVECPSRTVLILISDLFEGGNAAELLRHVQEMTASGVTIISLLALSDDGTPAFDESLAGEFAALGVSSFACTPDRFAELIAAAIRKQDLGQWAARNDIVTRGTTHEPEGPDGPVLLE